MSTGTIVVGVDGSRASRDALRWAVDEARMRGTTVEAVHVWHYPALTCAAVLAPAMLARTELEEGARALLDQEVEDVLAAEFDPPEVNRVLLEGAPAPRLVQHSADADLLVVGRRGHGLSTVLAGSVAQHCSAHATCPVVVVAAQRRRADVRRWPVRSTGDGRRAKAAA